MSDISNFMHVSFKPQNMVIFISRRVQFSRSVVSDSLWPHEPQHARPSIWISSNSCPLSRWCHPTISSCHPLLLLSPIPPSIRAFSNESALHITWPKYWSFSFNISPSNEHPELISFRMDWLDLLAVQGTLKSLLQYHSSKAKEYKWPNELKQIKEGNPIKYSIRKNKNLV